MNESVGEFVQNVQICNVNRGQHDSVHIIMVVMNVVYFENCIRKIKQILCKTCSIHCKLAYSTIRLVVRVCAMCMCT